MEFSRHALSPPSLEEIAAVWAEALPHNYVHSSATVVDCPDLCQPPFGLAAPGLSGGARVVADIGGQANLFPEPRRDKNYGLLKVAHDYMGMNVDEGGEGGGKEGTPTGTGRGLLIGAGAGPNRVHGINSELVANMSWEPAEKPEGADETSFSSPLSSMVMNLSRSVRVVVEDPGETHDNSSAENVAVACPLSGSTECALMANVYGSQGLPGPVIRVTARGRRGDEASLTEFLRKALLDQYGPGRPVSIGGVFVLLAGHARFHVMPDFPPASELPFRSREVLQTWLTFHDFGGPMTCLTVFHSSDPHNLGLRMEHTHCFASDGKPAGGHYHYDLPANGHDEEVQYEGYFNVADTLVQVDRAPAYWEEAKAH